MITGGDISSRF